ncbi:MAG TPA: exopolyphosphatase [Gammaproteobacteria bacterium]
MADRLPWRNPSVADSTVDRENITIAAIDLGSNSFHLVVAQMVNGQLRVLDRLREMVRLAAGLDQSNQLERDARERAIACLKRFGQRLREMPPGSVRAVGTNTLRKLRDPEPFLAEAAAALGHPIEIIAGREEARLIYLGVSHGLPDCNARRLVVDIGGGSTELILGERFEPMQMESLHMGCVSASQAYFASGEIREKSWNKAVIAARLELQAIEADYRRRGWGEVVGASGTIRAVADVIRAQGWSSNGITFAALQRLVDVLLQAGHVAKLNLPGLKEERLAVFPGGVAVLYAIFQALGIEQMADSEWALREGVLYDQVGRIRHEDVRERTIVALKQTYHVDVAQSQRVEQTAQMVLARVAESWQLDDDEARSLLSWAARLHEIGLAIAHNQYHKHAAYLLENSDMPGFSRQEQRMLALLVRSHRRKFPSALFNGLPPSQGIRSLRLASLLRLAVLLCRSRTDYALPAFSISTAERGLTLRFPAGWLDAHPLTAADLEQEAAYLDDAKFALQFS